MRRNSYALLSSLKCSWGSDFDILFVVELYLSGWYVRASCMYREEAVDQFEKYLRQRPDNTNFKVEAVCSGNFYLDGIYEDYPSYGYSSNIPIDSDYNAPDELPDAYDIEKYDKLIGGTFMLDLLLILLYWPPCPDDILIVGWW